MSLVMSENRDEKYAFEASVFNTEAQLYHIEYKIVVALERISEAFRVLIWEISKESGLSPIQLQILIFLLYHPEEKRKVSFLANEFHLTRPTISDAVRLLYQKKLIHKEIETHDKRSYIIHLTEKGSTIAKKASVYAQKISQSIHPLSNYDKSQMLHHLLQAIYHLQQAKVIHPQRMCFTCRFYQKENRHHFYCQFLQQQLPLDQLRVDCAEHQFSS